MLLKLFGISFIVAYLVHAFISGSIRLFQLPKNSYVRRIHFLGLFCFAIIALSPLLWLILLAQPETLTNTNSQLISNLWSCAMVAAPFIAIACVVYMHKALLGFEDRLPDLDDIRSRSKINFRRKPDLPIRIKRKHASATPIRTLTKTSARVQPQSERLDFEDTLATLFQQNQTNPSEKIPEQD